jgi:hypothetical protein
MGAASSIEYSRTVGAGQELGEKAAGKKAAGAPAMDGDHVSSLNCYGKITTLHTGWLGQASKRPRACHSLLSLY